MVVTDVLHACDLGITQDLIGNVMWEYMHHRACKGRNQGERVKYMWSLLKAHYQAMGTTTRLQALTREMIRQENTPPKLRAKGAETRGCLPWSLELSMEMAAATPSPHYQTVLQCVSRLMDLYMVMGVEPFQPQMARQAVRQFSVLYSALSKEAADTGHDELWRVKPKFHML